VTPGIPRDRAAQELASALQKLGGGAEGGSHFRVLVDGSLSAMSLLAPDGAILDANALACASLGAARDELLGTALWDTPPWSDAPESRQRVRALISAAARGVTVRQETPAAGETGSTTLDLAFNPVTDSSGAVALIVAEWRDVSDRRHAEDALRESEERFQRIVSIAVDAIISIDDAQRITLFNQGAEHIFGYTASEVLGQPLELLLPPGTGPLHAREVHSFGESAALARRMGERRQILGRRKNGEIFNAEASISKATIGNTRVFTAVLRDVSERWLAEQHKSELLAAAQHAQAVAERTTRQRDEMLEIVSHDLRNPLSAVTMCAGLLADPETPQDQRERLATTMTDAIEWANRLISDLLDIASIEAGRLSIQRRQVDPVIAIGQALSLFETLAAERGLRLHAAGVEHLPPIDADPRRLLQVLANLLANAVRFTDAGGAITIGADVADGAIAFSVRDTGSGIAREDLPHLFERRWHTGEPGPEGGTGLGLFIAHGIVEAHGGRISVESEPGRGTLFQFTIPLPAPEQA